MKVSTLVGYALAATFLGTAGPAFALSTTSPNTIELQHVTVSGSTGDSGGLAAVDVRFRNNGSVTANRIDFSVETPEGGTALVADLGAFAPGATVDHVLRIPALAGSQSPNETTIVRVSAVRYSDGSTWTAPAKQAAWEAPQPPAIPVGAYAL